MKSIVKYSFVGLIGLQMAVTAPALAQQAATSTGTRGGPVALPGLPSLQSLNVPVPGAQAPGQSSKAPGSKISLPQAAGGTADKPKISLPAAKTKVTGSASRPKVALPKTSGSGKDDKKVSLGQSGSTKAGFSALTPEEKKQLAFEMLKDRTIPLTPKQTFELHRLLDESQRAIATPPTPPPTPVSASLVVDLSPGVTPPVIRLAAGYISTLVFVDSTGAPWPIAGYGIGDPTTFNVQWDATSHILHIQSLKNYSSGNLVVRLINQSTPVTITLVTGQKQVDYRADLRVLGRGPNALAAVIDNSTDGVADRIMINLLDGIPPKNSLKLRVAGDNAQAWSYNGKVYYRTKLSLLSPAWFRTVSSPDGTKIYELPNTPLILASQSGKTTKIRLSGF